MARARLLKPTFFKNEELADLGLEARILFAGLWCLADREGRLEDRPRRIKSDVMPYDDCDVNEILESLHRAGFIRRYEAAGDRFIVVVNFGKHQTPHVKEAPSTIPAPGEPSASPVQDIAHFPSSSSLGLNPGTEALTGSLEPEPERAPARETAAMRPPPSPPPESLNEFHSILARLPGYDPSPEFYAKVGSKYGHLDLVEEAIKLASWLKANGEKRCSTQRVLGWLKRTDEQQRGKEVNGHADRAGIPATRGRAQGDARGGRARDRLVTDPSAFANIDRG